MKKYLANGIIFLLGAAVGGACTYFYCKNGEEDRINAEVKSVRDAFSKLSRKPNNDDSDEYDKDIGQDDKTRQNGLKCVSGAFCEDDNAKSKEERDSIISHENYSGYFDKNNVDENGALDPLDPRTLLIQDVINTAHPDDERDSQPYVMTDEMLENDPAASELICLTLYLKDQILADDLHEEAVSVDDTIGMDIFEKFLNSHETDEIFVKDPRLDVAYDIVKEDLSFKEMMETYHGGE